MTDLDRLGRRHKQLLSDLADLLPELADAVRAERESGATYQDLLARSGYKSVETIRQIVKPVARDSANRARRGRPKG